jgi:hypothetical protein
VGGAAHLGTVVAIGSVIAGTGGFLGARTRSGANARSTWWRHYGFASRPHEFALDLVAHLVHVLAAIDVEAFIGIDPGPGDPAA